MERFCLVSSVLAGCYIIHPAPGARGCRVRGAQRAPAWHGGGGRDHGFPSLPAGAECGVQGGRGWRGRDVNGHVGFGWGSVLLRIWQRLLLVDSQPWGAWGCCTSCSCWSQHFECSHFGARSPVAPGALVAFPVPAEDKLALRPGRNAPALCLVGRCPCVNALLTGVLFLTPSSSSSCCPQLGGAGCTWERQHFPACLMDTSVSI